MQPLIFFFQKTSLSIFDPFRQFCLSLSIYPAFEKISSDETDVAGTQKYLCASEGKGLNCVLDFQKFSGSSFLSILCCYKYWRIVIIASLVGVAIALWLFTRSSKNPRSPDWLCDALCISIIDAEVNETSEISFSEERLR